MNNTLAARTRGTPFVSVICPVFNAASTLARLLDGLLNQTYSPQDFEIIIVDNGSTDGSVEYLENRGVKVQIKAEKQSSYFARNQGIGIARGEVLAFTDSDCIPDSGWLEHGVAALQNQKLDLVGGKVQFYTRARTSSWNLFDSIVYMDNERCVRQGHAKTANLFVKSTVFAEVGPFQSGVTSGGDVEWTSRAVNAGFTLGFEANALVHHPARNVRESLRKALRVGRGKRVALAHHNLGWVKLIVRVTTCPIPVEAKLLNDRMKCVTYPRITKLGVYVVAIAVRLTGTIGILGSIGWKNGTKRKTLAT